MRRTPGQASLWALGLAVAGLFVTLLGAGTAGRVAGLGVLAIGLAALGITANLWGADSRDGRDW